MSVTVADIDTSAVVTGNIKVISFPAPPSPIEQQMRPAATLAAQLHVYNESPVGWKCLFPQSNKAFNLPAGAWAAVHIPANETELDLTAIYVIQNAVVNHLLADYYYANEPSDEISALGNSPVGTASAVATQLQATPSGITTGFAASQRIPNGGAVDPGTLVLYAFGGPYPAGADLYICNIDAGGVARPFLENNGFGQGCTIWGEPTAGTFARVFDVERHGNLDLIGQQAAVGFGVPVVVAQTPTAGVTVAVTTLTAIVSFVAPADGLYRANATVYVNNGTPNQSIILRASYTNARSLTGQADFFTGNNGGNGTITLDGSATRANGVYACSPQVVLVRSGSTLTIGYQDPGGTPADTVDAWIERLS